LRCQSTGGLVLTAKRPKSAKYPKTLASLGDHIRTRRLELNLLQREVAQLLEVNETSVYDWEKHRTDPMVHLIPRITHFLGCTPPLFIEQTTGQKIVTYRHVRGMSQRSLALKLKVDPGTLGRWERDESFPTGKLKLRLEPFFREILSGDGKTQL
jgi:transcriptional regulator with XRE-family HTH domain